MNAPSFSLILSRIALLAGFAALLCAPLAGWWLRIKAPTDFQEMQTLAPWPDWAATPRDQWPRKFEDWLNTHFPLRTQLIRAHSIVRHRWLGAPSASVVVGREDWLFFAGNRTFEDFVGRDPLTPAELAQWLAVLEGRQAWLAERGIRYLFVVVPNKSTVYAERLPSVPRANARPGKLDQLLDYLRANHSRVPVLDLRPALAAVKSRQQAYWTVDSHWNAHGLTGACDAITARVAALGLPVFTADTSRQVDIRAALRESDCADLLAMCGHWPRSPEPELRLRRPADLREAESPLAAIAPWMDAPAWKKPITTERESGQSRAVLLCDSFFRAGGVPLDALGQVPFMLNFRRFTSLWEWATFEQIQAIAKLEKPDVVIEEWTERYLKVIPEDHAEFARSRAAGRPTPGNVPAGASR